jgi:hypothetical protein
MALHCLCGGTLWRFGLRLVNGKLSLAKYCCTVCAIKYEQEVSDDNS